MCDRARIAWWDAGATKPQQELKHNSQALGTVAWKCSQEMIVCSSLCSWPSRHLNQDLIYGLDFLLAQAYRP